MIRWMLAAALGLAAPAEAEADVFATVKSPGRLLSVGVTLNGEGRASYADDRLGKPIIGDSQFSLLCTDAPQLLRNFRLKAQPTREADTRWTQRWGE